jgi:hypothetical protein
MPAKKKQSVRMVSVAEDLRSVPSIEVSTVSYVVFLARVLVYGGLLPAVMK